MPGIVRIVVRISDFSGKHCYRILAAMWLFSFTALPGAATSGISGKTGFLRSDSFQECSVPAFVSGIPDLLYAQPQDVVVDAGPDDLICSGSTCTLSGAGQSGATSLIWTTSGTGYFNDPGLLNPVYTPGEEDIAAGNVILTITGLTAIPGEQSSDSMTLSIAPAATAYAGNDAVICSGSSCFLSEAQVTNTASVFWSTSGTGVFSNPAALNPFYIPGPEDIETGSVILSLTATAAAPCEDARDVLVLTIAQPAVVYAGPDDHMCAGADYLLAQSTAQNYTSVHWTSDGSGHFNDPDILNPVYTPSLTDQFNGQVTLKIEAQSEGQCLPDSDEMVLTIDPIPFANAGTDMVTCKGEPFQVLGASAEKYTSVFWTSSGLGSIIGVNTLTPTYYPAATDTGSVMLTLNAVASQTCGNLIVSDTMTLSYLPAVFADAGPDQSIPYNSVTVLTGSAGNGSGSYVFNWQPESLLLLSNTTNPQTLPLQQQTDFILLVTDVVYGCQDVDTVRIMIDGANKPPRAADDFDTTRFQSTRIVNVLANDSDPENSGLTVSVCTNPANGQVIVNSDNTVTYTPYDGFSGIDSLQYQICDQGIPVLCDTASVYIQVLPRPDVSRIVICNLITPNGDGINDRWKINGIDDFPDNKVFIFSRWGDGINTFSHYDNLHIYWDGTNELGERVPDGTYYYILEIRNEKSISGWIYVRSES